MQNNGVCFIRLHNRTAFCAFEGMAGGQPGSVHGFCVLVVVPNSIDGGQFHSVWVFTCFALGTAELQHKSTCNKFAYHSYVVAQALE